MPYITKCVRDEATKENATSQPPQPAPLFYSWGVKLTLMSGEALCGMGGQLAGQPTMLKPVVMFRFMAPCSVLPWGCGGRAAEGGGAWKPLPGPAWEIGMAAVSTGGGATGAGGAGSAGTAGACCCCKLILLWCCFRLLGRKLPTITCHAEFYVRTNKGYIAQHLPSICELIRNRSH
jgi:hypothetical protein